MSFGFHPSIRGARTGPPGEIGPDRRAGLTTDGAQLRRAADPADLAAGLAFDEKYRPMVLQWCRGLGLRPERADELANDVLFEVLRRLPTFAYDPAKGFRRWLRTVVVRRACDARRRDPEPPVSLGDAERWIPSPEGDDAADAAFEALWERGAEAHRRVKARVKPTSWALFWMADIEGVPLSEAARALGLNYSNALKRLRQVRNALRREGDRVVDDGPAGATDEARP